ncbi:MAG: hypothetical protein D6784_01435 [Chloroflexi bacterium]|nr:MAG: hypothetical protein D6784_01435 [Chloroflexota bacterium]
MNKLTLTRLVAILGLVVCVAGIAFRLEEIMRRPYRKDLSRPRGDARRGLLYAFTLGLAPWEKESTRLHWLAYLRGIVFHVGIFVALLVFFASPWLAALPLVVVMAGTAITAVGAVAGFAGIWLRRAEENLRALSLPDDYLSVLVTSLFVTLAFAVLVWPASLPLFYLVSGVMLAYIPFSKIRHCVYFFYSRFFFGQGFGHRGVIGQPPGEYAE